MEQAFSTLALDHIGDDRRAQVESQVRDATVRNDVRVKLIKLTSELLGTKQDARTPYIVKCEAKVVAVVDATDSSVRVWCKPNSEYQHQDPTLLRQNGKTDFGSAVGGIALYWDAQAGKEMTLVVLSSGTYDSGNINSNLTGGVNISEGTTVTTRDRTGLTIASAGRAIVIPADADRAVETICNLTGQTLYFGDANVTDENGNYPGIPVLTGGQFIWKNKGACYAYNPGAALTNAKIARNVEK